MESLVTTLQGSVIPDATAGTAHPLPDLKRATADGISSNQAVAVVIETWEKGFQEPEA